MSAVSNPNGSTHAYNERVSDAAAFLTAHFGRLSADERFAINTFKPFSHKEFTADQIQQAAMYAINLSKTNDVYFGMAITSDTMPVVANGQRFSSANVAGGYTLWVEVDYEAGDAHTKTNLPPTLEAAHELLNRFGAAPSQIIHSGHGLHAYWFLNERLTREHLTELEMRLQGAIKGFAEQSGWTIDPTADMARVLRVAGTLNHKERPPVDVTFVSQTDTLYSVDEVLNAIECAPIPSIQSKSRSAKASGVSVVNDLVIDPFVVITDELRFRIRTYNEKAWATFIGERNALFNNDRNRIDESLMSLMALTTHTDGTPVFTQQEIVDAAIQARRESGEKDKHNPAYYWTRTLEKVLPEVETEAEVETQAEVEAQAETETSETLDDNKIVSFTPKTKALNIPTIDPSDVGNADRYIRLFRDVSRYVKEEKAWYVLHRDTMMWSADNDSAAAHIRRVAEDINRDINELSRIKDDTSIDEATRGKAEAMEKTGRKWIVTCKSGSHPETMLKQARSGLMLEKSLFNHEPMAMATLDGAIDLKTGQSRKRVSEDYFTKRSEVNYSSSATAPRWQAFLNQMFRGDAALIDYVQRALGYCLTGRVGEHKMFVLYGDGRNGKSTMIDTVAKIMGDYAMPIPASTLTTQDYTSGATPWVADLKGSRLAIASESDVTARFDEARIKALTGGDPITARKLYGNPITFLPTHKFWLLTNHRPEVRGVDKAIWSRLVLIPMTVTVPESEKDINLKDKLMEEAEGILAWLVEGCLKWQQRGLDVDVPEAISQATEKWRESEDVLAEFIDELFVIDPEGFTSTDDMMRTYRDYCNIFKVDGRKEALNTRTLKKLLEAKGFKAVHTKTGNGYRGLARKPYDPDDRRYALTSTSEHSEW